VIGRLCKHGWIFDPNPGGLEAGAQTFLRRNDDTHKSNENTGMLVVSSSKTLFAADQKSPKKGSVHGKGPIDRPVEIPDKNLMQ
jgi:hypothetical protein